MKIPFEFEGHLVEADAQYVKGQLWMHVAGRSFIYEPGNKKRARGRKGSDTKSGEILAPMPGKITKILRSQGESVVQGDMVLVMEAMKMEYTLKANIDGTIESLHCQVGDQVALGKILARIR